MSHRLARAAVAAAIVLATGAARADLVSVLQSAPIAASSAVAFQNSAVTPGTVSADGVYNFLDRWKFTLDGTFEVSTIAASIAFTDPSGQSVLFGITNLQVNLVSDAGPVLVSWRTVSAPVTGLEQTVALIPNNALGAGDYWLDVRGTVVQPGAYSGSLVAQPAVVPLPASSALFFGGLLAMGFTANRLRRR